MNHSEKVQAVRDELAKGAHGKPIEAYFDAWPDVAADERVRLTNEVFRNFEARIRALEQELDPRMERL